MLKQFIADRDKRIEHLIAELEKAKAQSLGGSNFKKYVQLKSQNVELQNELQTLSKQVNTKTSIRGGRRAVGNKYVDGIQPVLGGISQSINPSSLAADSVGSDFADERNRGDMKRCDLNADLTMIC